MTTVSLYAMKGETVGFELRDPRGTELPENTTAFEIKTVKTLMPSFKGAVVGAHEDPLVPVTAFESGKHYWIDVTVLKTQVSGTKSLTIGGQTVSLRVVNRMLPERPTMPMYMELQFANVGSAHKIPNEGLALAKRGEINAKYRALYRAHRIEPIKQAVSFAPTDLDQWRDFGVSFRQTTLENTIADPCLLGPNPGADPTKAQLDLLYDAAPNGWIYGWDEGQTDACITEHALERVKLIKRLRPEVKVWITREEASDFRPYVDRFIPVFEWFNQPGHVPVSEYTKEYGLYGSCMANGNCQNKNLISEVEKATGTPMMVLDAPSVHRRAYPLVAYKLGAKLALYYNGTQRLATAWEDGGQYNEGGNGDGTLVYPLGEDPCPSLRMKYLRTGLNDVEWIEAAKKRGISVGVPMTHTFDWSKNNLDYQNMRRVIAERL